MCMCTSVCVSVIPSSLAQLQSRYQRRQLADKEQRLLQLYADQRAHQERAARRLGQRGQGSGQGSAGSSSSSTSSLPCGKVRQLFEGRRQQGRDRGQPLAPLGGAPGARPARSSSNVNLSQSYHFGQQVRGHSLDRHPLRRPQGDWGPGRRLRSQYNSDSSESDSESPSPPPYSQSFAIYEDIRQFNRLPNVGGSLSSQMAPPAPARLSAAAPARRAPARLASNENAPPAAAASRASVSLTSPSSKLPARKPTGLPTPVPVTNRASPLRPASGQRSAPSPSVTAARPAPAPAPATRVPAAKPHTNGVAKTASKVPSSPQRMAASKTTASQPLARAQPRQDDGLAPCSICGRRFAPDRVAKHQEICSKAGQKKRKTFDPVIARVKGTEAEKYVRRAKVAPQPKAMNNNNWRRKHEDFIQTIRAAKQVQAHIAKGGKVSDLPPPPPSDYSDYVPCPHCGRKFNQTAAERHIPKCATMIHNKPKPKPGPAGGRGVPSRR